jgi:hypothetical protein
MKFDGRTKYELIETPLPFLQNILHSVSEMILILLKKKNIIFSPLTSTQVRCNIYLIRFKIELSRILALFTNPIFILVILSFQSKIVYSFCEIEELSRNQKLLASELKRSDILCLEVCEQIHQECEKILQSVPPLLYSEFHLEMLIAEVLFRNTFCM